MEPSKAASFFQEVETKTARGRLKWQPTATDDLIAAIGGEFTLRLVRPTSDDEFDYALFLHDAQHRQLVRIGYQMGLPGVTSSRLKELFMIAMDQALGVDEQLERVIGVLDKL